MAAYHQERMREADWWKTSFRSQLGQFEWKVGPFGFARAARRASSRLIHEHPRHGRPPGRMPVVEGGGRWWKA